jgi:membrane protein required for colicin V production
VDPTRALDGAVAAILLLAAARGLARGLIREVFSIAALAAAVLAVRWFAAPAAAWLDAASEGRIGPAAAPWVAGALLAIGAIAVVAIAGRALRSGARAAGLGLADRLGGGAVGALEGALVAALLLIGAVSLLGPESEALRGSRSYRAFTDLQAFVAGAPAADVAAGPERGAP